MADFGLFFLHFYYWGQNENSNKFSSPIFMSKQKIAAQEVSFNSVTMKFHPYPKARLRHHDNPPNNYYLKEHEAWRRFFFIRETSAYGSLYLAKQCNRFNLFFVGTGCSLYNPQGHPTTIFRKYLFGRRFEI